MKKKLTVLIRIFLIMILAGTFLPSLAGGASKSKPVKLTALCTKPPFRYGTRFQQFIQKVQELSGGSLVIDWLGSAEVIPRGQQPLELQKGTIDIVASPLSFLSGLIRGADVLSLSNLTPAEERAGGGYDFLDGIHAKVGFKYLGRGDSLGDKRNYFKISTNKRTEKPEDFKGQIVSDGDLEPLLLQYGATVIRVGPFERYGAMQQHTVDTVAGTPFTSSADLGLHEVTRYVIDHSFGNASHAIVLNLNSWNKLSKSHQDILTKATIWLEDVKAAAMSEQEEEKARKTYKDAGVEFIKWSDADVARFFGRVDEFAWKKLIKKHPDVGPRLKELFYK